MTKIGIDANSMMNDRGGVGWHTYYLLRAMLELSDDVSFAAYVQPGTMQRRGKEPWMQSAAVRWIESGRWGRRWRSRLDGLDLYHGPNFKLHTTGRYGGVVTIHDLWLDRHPEYSKKFFGQNRASRRAKRTARAARAVITVSHFSARELMALYDIPAEQVHVIPNGVSEEFLPLRDQAAIGLLRARLGLGAGPYLLFVGGADPRKNHRTFLGAVALRRKELSRFTLVLVGSATDRFGNFNESAREFELERQVVCTGRLPIQDIRLLYSYAHLFIYPSLYEGFGMPVLEAMACGAPVVTSASTALGEVAGDAAVLVDPEDPSALAADIVRLSEDEALRATMRQRGFERIKQFTWQQAAAQTLSLYRELCR
ncbi:MAG TPA: glycosyltransferase family 1 protein [Nitrospira sp.]|nr:glycosyltransferase family 1 protein [Nitrospira sp.]